MPRAPWSVAAKSTCTFTMGHSGCWHGLGNTYSRKEKRRPPAWVSGKARPSPAMGPAHSTQICTGSQVTWKHLGPSGTEELIKVQQGHGDNTGSDLFRDLGPYLHENRSLKSTLTSTKWSSGCQEVKGICQPSQQTGRGKRLCPEDDDALMHCLQKKKRKRSWRSWKTKSMM